MLVDVNICLAHKVLDLVQPRFQPPMLKDRISGRRVRHTRQGLVVVKV